MKISCLYRLTLANIYNKEGFIRWSACLYSSGKYPVIIYTDPVRTLVVKYKNIIEAGDDYASRSRILARNGHKIVLTDEGTKFICEYYRIKFG